MAEGRSTPSSGSSSRGHVAILRSPGAGHLVPVAEFAKLLFRRGFSVSIISFTVSSTMPEAESSVLDTLPRLGIATVTLPPPPMEDIAPTSRLETRLWVAAARSRASLSQLLLREYHLPSPPNDDDEHSSSSTTPVLLALVVDLFGIQASEVAQELNVPCFLFYTTSLTNLCLVLGHPKVDKTISGEFRDVKEPIKFPGCSLPVHGIDLCDPIQERSDEVYTWFMDFCWRCRKAVKGIFVNSFAELEPDILRSWAVEGDPEVPGIYPVGPLVRMITTPPPPCEEVVECLRWLDGQPPNKSVLYVSFGSGGTLSSAQLQELAMGLEMSEQRFLWVVRRPNDESRSAAFLNSGAGEAADHTRPRFPSYLPEGFVSRMEKGGLGFVVESWAPQVRVLSHPATGGFMSHCGWNSTLESIVNGVPILAWPMYAEQRINALMLVEGLKVAIRVDAAAGQLGINKKTVLVGREAIARAVRSLMEGEEGKKMRSRMEELQAKAKQALEEEEKKGKSWELGSVLLNRCL